MSGARDAIVRSRASTPCQTQPGRFTSRLRVLARRSLDGVDTRAYSVEVLKHSPIEKKVSYSSLTFLLPAKTVALRPPIDYVVGPRSSRHPGVITREERRVDSRRSLPSTSKISST